MNSKYYVGRRVSSLETYSPVGPITGVTLVVDENNEYLAGDDTGYVMEVECPYGTQAMADNMLANLSGKTYHGYRADAVELAPEAELGDGITVDGVYSMLAYRSVGFGPGHMSEIAAPGENELDHEYHYETPTERTERKIAATRSLITKTAEEIRLEVQNELNGLSSSLSVRLDEINATVTGLDNSVSTLTQKVDNITLSVSNGTSSSTIALSVDGVTVSSKTIRFTGGVVFESDLADGTTSINGACIDTGTISADYIKLGGEMEVYRTSSSTRLGGYMGYVTGYDYNGSSTSGMGMMEPGGDNQVVVTTGGARLTTPTAEVVTATNITLQTDNAVNVYASKFTSDVDLTVSSDRNLKDDIRYDITEKYMALFDQLSPVSFVYKNKETVRHLGFIAQEVEDAAVACGIENADLALLNIDENGRYGLAYSEFIPILVAKIKSLENRLEALSV